jgi:hypothetical protein
LRYHFEGFINKDSLFIMTNQDVPRNAQPIVTLQKYLEANGAPRVELRAFNLYVLDTLLVKLHLI